MSSVWKVPQTMQIPAKLSRFVFRTADAKIETFKSIFIVEKSLSDALNTDNVS